MAELLDLVASSGTPGRVLAWVLLAGAGLSLWVGFARARTAVLIERQRRAAIRRAARRSRA